MVLRFTILVGLLWSVLIGASGLYNINVARESSLDRAYAEAQAILNKDITFRRWGTRHGGVYVPVGENQQPIPFMEHVPGRDVVTTDGKSLTLVNPASMLRQMMDTYAKDFGVRGRITGLKYLNPQNAPDAWEAEQIRNFGNDMSSAREVWKLAEIDGQPFLRYLRAMHMEDGCQKCHGHLGYEVGEVRGATGINLPMATYLQRYNNTRLDLMITHFLIWLVVLSAIVWIGRKAARQEEILEMTVKERTFELEASRDAAQSGLRSREQFIANMSHEIRTPMNAIMGYSEVVSHDPLLTDSSKKRVGIIYSSARNLLGMLNDILDFSKIVSGNFSLETTRFHLKNAVDDLLAPNVFRIQEKGLTFVVQYSDDLPTVVSGDPTRLRQILSNLLDNALKFTDTGTISLTVGPAEKANHIQFSLSDTGIGMSKAQLDRIFEPFIQADQSTTRRFGGTGLGTGIARQIVEMMGGALWVDSCQGTGSTFHFVVPLPAAPHAKDFLYEGDKKIDRRYTSPRVFNVLLAEDQEANADLVKLWLEDEGHSVRWAKNGLDAANLFKSHKFDIVLMDIQMPVMDGLNASQSIRKYENTVEAAKPVPIMALTASVMRADLDKCVAAGIDDVLSKPVNRNELLKNMEKMVSQGQGTPVTDDVRKERLPSFAESAAVSRITNSRQILERWGKEETYVAALRLFAASHTDDAVLLKRYLTEAPQNFDKAVTLLHALKGVSGNLMLSEIQSLSLQLEKSIRFNKKHNQHEMLMKLSVEIDRVVEEIKNINQEKTREQEPVDHQEKSERIGAMWGELLDAVDQLDPARASLFVKKLEKNMTPEVLESIERLIGEFDFDAAKELINVEIESQPLTTNLDRPL
ncbi:MAG: response regulator [Proteobacteria bacterium]|nr:response regulator [Pseudomonadota bacterium]